MLSGITVCWKDAQNYTSSIQHRKNPIKIKNVVWPYRMNMSIFSQILKDEEVPAQNDDLYLYFVKFRIWALLLVLKPTMAL